MSASEAELAELGARLWVDGIAGYCPTTLSTDPKILAQAVSRLGSWIQSEARRRDTTRALPLGIHLEGPFINSACCGAHPPSLIRKLDLTELEQLWKLSCQTLKILTIAPETLSPEELKSLAKWAKERKISLSLGHSKATETQANEAFSAGFRGITHAWNALSFHQRSPGALGAALGNDQNYIELIMDQIHVAPSVMEWTQKLHPANRLCMISDCVPAAETFSGETYPFGPLKIQFKDGACRLPGGSLAGGGKSLTRSFREWVQFQAARNGDVPRALPIILKKMIPSITQAPLFALQLPPAKLSKYRVEWSVLANGQVQVSPIDSK